MVKDDQWGYTNHTSLVVWNMNFIFPFSWACHNPNWRTPSFFRGVGSTWLNHQPVFFSFVFLQRISDSPWTGRKKRSRPTWRPAQKRGDPGRLHGRLPWWFGPPRVDPGWVIETPSGGWNNAIFTSHDWEWLNLYHLFTLLSWFIVNLGMVYGILWHCVTMCYPQYWKCRDFFRTQILNYLKCSCGWW